MNRELEGVKKGELERPGIQKSGRFFLFLTGIGIKRHPTRPGGVLGDKKLVANNVFLAFKLLINVRKR